MKQTNRLLSDLMAAAAEPIGLVIRANCPIKPLAAAFARARATDPSLSHIQIRMSPLADGDILLCRGSQTPHRTPNPEME